MNETIYILARNMNQECKNAEKAKVKKPLLFQYKKAKKNLKKVLTAKYKSDRLLQVGT